MTADKRGGARPGAGRPEVKNTRKNRTLKARDEEWTVINIVADIYKHGSDEARREIENFAKKYNKK